MDDNTRLAYGMDDNPQVDQRIIDEIETVYMRIGMITGYNHSTPEAQWDCTTQASLASHMKRCKELTKYLVDAGYEYDWFKGWTLEMVTTPVK